MLKPLVADHVEGRMSSGWLYRRDVERGHVEVWGKDHVIAWLA